MVAIEFISQFNEEVREFTNGVSLFTDSTGTNVNVRHELSSLEAAMKELEKARSRMKAYLLRTQHDVERRLDRSSILAATGGCPGTDTRLNKT